jgi:hypothetical protein
MFKTLNIFIGTALLIMVGFACLLLFNENYETYLPAYFEGLGSFTGNFLGVIAGIATTLGVQSISKLQSKKALLQNFVFELTLNKDKMEKWILETTDYRNAVNGDALGNYFGYFNLSSFLGVIANQIHNSGDVYNILTREQFKQLQVVFNEMTWEVAINKQISDNRDYFIANQNTPNWLTKKPEIVGQINHLEQKFRSHINVINTIIEHIKLNNKI